MRKVFVTAIAAAAGFTFLAVPTAAETMMFKAPLSAAEEVPPNSSKGTGNVEATYDTATKKLSWKGSYSGLTGAATAAHFHGPAQRGQNASVVVPADAAKSPFEGGHADRRASRRPDEGELVFQHPHGGEQGGRDSRPSYSGEIVSPAK